VAIALVSVWPTAFAMGALIPSGPIWFLLATAGAMFLIVWPATMLTARLALNGRPFDAISPTGR